MKINNLAHLIAEMMISDAMDFDEVWEDHTDQKIKDVFLKEDVRKEVEKVLD